jgi:PAS domain S-box-containing protein
MERLHCKNTFADSGKLYEILVAELSDFVIVLIDRTGCLASWNPGVETHFGYTEQEFVGREACLLFTPEDIEGGIPEKEIKTATREGRAADVRWHIRKDGSRIFVEGVLVVLRDEKGAILGFAKVMRDITERKVKEDRLEELTHALNQAQTLVRTLDGTIRFWSEGSSRLYGFSKEEAIGKNAHELLKTRFPEPVEAITGRLSEHNGWQGTVHQRRKDGSLVISKTDWTLHEAKNDGDTPTVVEANTDITELILTEEKLASALKTLERTSAELQRSNDDLKDFARFASHDLKAPLNTIGNFTQLLGRRYGEKLGPDAQEVLGIIQSNVRRMGALISDLLRYAEVTEADAAPAEPVNVRDIIDIISENLRSLIEGSQASVTSDCPLPSVRVPATELVQLFQNLISNAIQYRSVEPPRVHISCQKEPQKIWLFSVTDNGIGIDPRHSDRIFLPFKRLHGAEIPGTGIGLAICKKVVERHGGRIWVESDIGKGSTFYFTLPA